MTRTEIQKSLRYQKRHLTSLLICQTSAFFATGRPEPPLLMIWRAAMYYIISSLFSGNREIINEALARRAAIPTHAPVGSIIKGVSWNSQALNCLSAPYSCLDFLFIFFFLGSEQRRLSFAHSRFFFKLSFCVCVPTVVYPPETRNSCVLRVFGH